MIVNDKISRIVPHLAGAIMICVAIAVIVVEVRYETDHPIVCFERSKVKSILALNYRDATVALENGNNMVVNQARLAPGSEVCIKYGRK